MDHLTYQETANRPFDVYYSKFKKMVKEDLHGNGWFLLVNDFPFKDGDKIMFTAGEDIGKWQDKNLSSLYGKTNYIIGRCRKRGPVLTLLDFQEGDYIKVARESGLRKELKEYFKGTGVSVRIFRSLKVDDDDLELSDQELEEGGTPLTEEEKHIRKEKEDKKTSSEAEVPELKMPEMKPSSIKKTLQGALSTAKKLGVEDEQEFFDLMTQFQKSVPQAVMMKLSLNKLNMYFDKVKLNRVDEEVPSGAFMPEMQAKLDTLEEQKKKLLAEYARLQKRIGNNLEFIQDISDIDVSDLEELEHQLLLAEENEKYLVRMETIKTELKSVKRQLAKLRSTART